MQLLYRKWGQPPSYPAVVTKYLEAFYAILNSTSRWGYNSILLSHKMTWRDTNKWLIV